MFVFVTVVCAFVCVCECVFDNMCVLLNSHCVDFRLKLMFVLRNGKVTVFSSKIFACGGLLAGSPSGWPASAKCWGAPCIAISYNHREVSYDWIRFEIY